MDTRKLDQLLRVLKKKSPIVHVGVLAGKNARQGTGTNAEIGAKHEFGIDGMPQRSFLKVPISDNLEKYLTKAGALDQNTVLKEAMAANSLVPLMKKVGITAEKIVSDAFASSGFGKWTPWKIPGYENNTGQVLVDTQQLRNSITSEVKE